MKGNLIQTTKYTSNCIGCQYATTWTTSSAKDFPHDPFIASCDISIFGMKSHKGLTSRKEHNFKLQTTYNYQIQYTWIKKSSKGNLIQTTKYTSNCIAGQYATPCPTWSDKDFPHDPFIAICDISIFDMNSQKDLTLGEEPNFKLQTTYNYQINYT